MLKVLRLSYLPVISLWVFGIDVISVRTFLTKKIVQLPLIFHVYFLEFLLNPE